MSAASLARLTNHTEGQRVRNRYPIRPTLQALIDARIARGISCRELARRSGYSADKVWRIEHGCQDAPLSYVEDIAQTLKLTVVVA